MAHGDSSQDCEAAGPIHGDQCTGIRLGFRVRTGIACFALFDRGGDLCLLAELLVRYGVEVVLGQAIGVAARQCLDRRPAGTYRRRPDRQGERG